MRIIWGENANAAKTKQARHHRGDPSIAGLRRLGRRSHSKRLLCIDRFVGADSNGPLITRRGQHDFNLSCARGAIDGLLLKQRHRQVRKVGRQPRVDRFGRLRLLVLNRLQCAENRGGTERKLVSGHLIQHATQREQIAATVQVLSLRLLR